MASPFTRGPANVDDLLTATLDEYRGTLTENWMAGNPITKKMKEQENVDFIDGGVSIVEDIEYAANDTAGWVAQSDVLTTSNAQILTQAKFLWAVLAGTVTIGDHDEAKNSGKNALHNLLKTRVKNLENTFIKKMEVALTASSTLNANTMWSLLDIIDSSDPSLSSLGDIARATYSWWAATETASGSMATTALEDIRTAYYTTSRALTDPVNMMVCDQTSYTSYQARLTPQEILTSSSTGDLEFDHLAFAGKPVFFSDSMGTGIWLGINTKYLRLRINKNMNALNQPFVRAPGGQSRSSVVQTMCQLTCTRPASQFKLTGITA